MMIKKKDPNAKLCGRQVDETKQKQKATKQEWKRATKDEVRSKHSLRYTGANN